MAQSTITVLVDGSLETAIRTGVLTRTQSSVRTDLFAVLKPIPIADLTLDLLKQHKAHTFG